MAQVLMNEITYFPKANMNNASLIGTKIYATLLGSSHSIPNLISHSPNLYSNTMHMICDINNQNVHTKQGQLVNTTSPTKLLDTTTLIESVSNQAFQTYYELPMHNFEEVY